MKNLGTYTVIQTNDGSKPFETTINHSINGTINYLKSMKHVDIFSVNEKLFSNLKYKDRLKKKESMSIKQVNNSPLMIKNYASEDSPLSLTVIQSGSKGRAGEKLYHVVYDHPEGSHTAFRLNRLQIFTAVGVDVEE